ncbi:type VII secretion protein EccCb [Actinoallomurus iriomotensis]|uniref:Type VII secretion protein EccC n=1 Tax=Actinoallomurus iriomotensis TaxID=478107 RepID=A0A9W6VVE1_9ACTN|nr:type VII secretion protein EccCb [Actinoallomurus iriomotensis]GLY86603.1 type VII secretion protein EccC [Actinoallomurus iriomotensis]
MSRVLLHRPARVLPPAVPTEPIVLVPPPAEPPAPPPGSWFQLLLPMMSGVSGMMFMLYNPRPLYIVIGSTMAVGSIGMSFAMFHQQRALVRRKSRADAAEYRAYLRKTAAQARAVASMQAVGSGFAHPDVRGRWAICRNRVRVWERRPDHPDFLTVRIGTGDVPLATPIGFQATGDGPFAAGRTELRAEAERLIARAGRLSGQPILLDLRETPVVSLVGSAVRTRAMAVDLVTELTTFCAPDDLLVAVCHPKEVEDWEFVKWLPHARAGESVLALPDGDGFGELLAEDLERRRDQARRRTSPFTEQPADESRRRLLVIVDGYGAASPAGRLDILGELAERAPALEVSVVFCVEVQRDEPPRVQTRVRVADDGAFTLESPDGEATGQADPSDPVLRTAIARSLAPLRLDDPAARTALSETTRLVELLGTPAARHLDVTHMWSALSSPYDVLRVPIGVSGDGQPEILDLKESAMQGMGPHGLVVGATGSGKSELLRTLVTALALTHPPDVLSLVLVDFKGGAAFAGLADLPHVAGMITNLADDLTMVDRMYLALFGEQQRRQKLLRDAGDVDNVREYQRRRAAGLLGPDAPPLPYLLIVVDEFGELLAGRPDFIELFVAIGRLGRSLGMHLLLSSQRLEEGRLRGLESHLSYRICLRTFSSVESNVVIGKPDAYHLPPVPGSAYLKVDTTIYDRFRAALVSAPDMTPEEMPDDTPRTALFTAGAVSAEPESASVAPASGDGERPTEMATAVTLIRAAGASPAHQVWLPPLDPKIPLGRLLPPPERDPRRGLQARGWTGAGLGAVPVGVLDLPEAQAQRPFGVDFTRWAGHLAVVGAPQTGKSTFLRTMLLSALVTHTPRELNAYVIDYGGGSLFALAGAPHVGAVSGRLEPDKVRRVVGQIWKLVDERDERFRELGIDSAETMRRRRGERDLPPEAVADVLLVIDGWGAVRTELEDLDPQILDIAARGQRVGVHLVIAANRWMELRPQLRDNIGGRMEFRLNDPADSQINRKAAASLPSGAPGRALTMEGDHVQVALPELGTSVEEVVSAAASAWQGPAAPPIRLLPAELSHAHLPGPGEDTERGVPIGIDELELGPVHLDLAGADSHFVVLGDAESGKTTFLRSWLAGLQARRGGQEAMFLVIDYRRTLLGAVRQEQTWAYCGAAPAAVAAVKELADGIVERLPPATLTPKILAERSWWTGPEFYVVVDDYDLVASPSGNPLLPLVDLLAQGHDLGLHVVLARRVGGMARGGFEPLLGRLRELRQPGLVMSGDPGEGPVLGNVRATAQPPGRGLLVRRKQRPVLVQTAQAPVDPLAADDEPAS